MTPFHAAALVSRHEEIDICVANSQTAYINCWQSTVAQEHYASFHVSSQTSVKWI